MLYVDDRLPFHPKIFKAGDRLGKNGAAQALALYLAGLSYAREHLTDGFVPDKFVASCGLVQTPQSVANVLASRSVRLWHRTRGGYRIHDFHDWNRKASVIKEMREKARLKKAAQRAADSKLSRQVSRQDGAICPAGTPRARVFHVPRTTSTSTSGVEVQREILVPRERAVAAPHSRYQAALSPPHPLSIAPAPDGNLAVIVKIAHEVLEELQTTDPSPEACERVKERCARRRIDYGRHPIVAKDVVRKAVESAAVQRGLALQRRSA